MLPCSGDHAGTDVCLNFYCRVTGTDSTRQERALAPEASKMFSADLRQKDRARGRGRQLDPPGGAGGSEPVGGDRAHAPVRRIGRRRTSTGAIAGPCSRLRDELRGPLWHRRWAHDDPQHAPPPRL
jgi:hypothetical protein